MPEFFQDPDAIITAIERWNDRKKTVQSTVDSINPEQAVNISRLARMFPFVSPGVIRSLGQMGMGPDDQVTQFAITQEMLRNYSTVGDWSGQLGKPQRETKYDTESASMPVRPKPTSGDEAHFLNSPDAPANKFARMQAAQDLLADGEKAGVFNPTTQMLVEPDFDTPEYGIFTKLQDAVYGISKSPVPYLARDGKIRGFTPTGGTTGDMELDLATGQPILPEDRPDPTITGAYRNPSGVGGSIGRVEDYGRGQQQDTSAAIISQIFADSETKATEQTQAKALEQLSNPQVSGSGLTGLAGPQTYTRPFFIAADAPIQEATGQIRNIYAAAHGEDVNWLESQSDLGVVLGKGFKDVNVGSGFFVDPESAVAKERRTREAKRGQIGGHNLSIGRILANTVTEPDTKPFQIISGLTDAAAQIGADPTTYVLGGVGEGQDAAKLFTAYDDIEEGAGIFRGLRAHYQPKTYKAWSVKNAGVREKLVELADPYDIYRFTGGKLDPALTADLSLADDVGTVDALLDDAINSGTLRKTTDLVPSSMAGRAKRNWSELHRTLNPDYNPRTYRFAKMMPDATFDLEDQSQVARNIIRVMQNAHADEQNIREVYNGVAFAKSRNGLRNAIMDAQSRTGGLLESYGISNPEVVSAVTRINTSTYNESLRGLIDDVGADLPTWEQMTIDGKIMDIGGPHLPLEHIGRYINIPDQRVVRRLTTKFNFLTAKETDLPLLTPLKIKAGKEVLRDPKTVGDLRIPFAAADWLMSEWLKPAWLMRLAWPIRVIGEEQIRMAAAGLDSLTSNPLSHIAIVIGGDQTRMVKMLDKMTPGLAGKMAISPSGALFEETEALKAVTYRAHAAWLDEPGVIRGKDYTVFTKNNPHELADWRSSWAHELALLHNDPVSHFVANSTREDAIEWLMNGAGNKYRRELMEAHPGNLENIRQVEKYVDTVVSRISRATSDHPDLIEMVQSGKFSKFSKGKETIGDVFLDKQRINPQFTHHLSGYDEVGPDKVKGSVPLMQSKGHDFMDQKRKAVDRIMATLMGTPTSTLSRAPAFKQFVWKRATELMPFADDEARVVILENAKKAGLNNRQMKSLEKAAGRGTKFKAAERKIIEVSESPLDYGGVKAKRYAIYDDEAKASKQTYFNNDDGLIGFVDYTPKYRGDETFVHYVAVRKEYEGEGVARKLMDKVYNSTEDNIDWGEIHSEGAGKLHGEFKAKYPDRGNYGKNRYGKLDPDHVSKVPAAAKTFAGKLNADDIDLLAKGYAIDDTKELLYDLSERSQINDIMRILVPFGEAWKEVLTRWAKLATITGPGGIPLPGKPVRRLQQIITGARGTDFGNFMGAGVDPITGKDRGFFYENEFGEEVYTYPGSEWLTSALTKVPVPLTGRVQGLNMFGNILPGLGPVAQIPAAWYLQDKPQHDWWRQQLLPFGAPGAEKTEDIFSLRDYMPAWGKTAIDWMANGGDDRVYNSSVMYAASYLYSTGEYGDNQAEQQRLLSDAKGAARDLYKVRAFGQFTLPSSPTFEWVTKSKDGQLLNTRILAEEFYNLQQDDYDTAVEKFLDMYGPYAIGAIVPHSRNVISAVPTSLEGASWVSKHKSIKANFPYVYGFFAPEGEFHMETFARNYLTGEREAITPEEWLNLRDTMIGNFHYQKAKGMLGADANSPNKEQAAWLRTQRDNILKMYPNWNNQVGLAQRPENEQMIAQLYDASKNRTVKQTGAGKGLIEYLKYRDKAVTQAETLGFVSFKTANDLAPTRQWLTDQAYKIIQQYPEFERLWDVVFSREMEDATVEPKTEAA